MIQKYEFKANGRVVGFVLHKIPHGRDRISAWYGREGTLLDAEYKRVKSDGRIQCQRVSARHWRVLEYLQTMGARYQPAGAINQTEGAQ